MKLHKNEDIGLTFRVLWFVIEITNMRTIKRARKRMRDDMGLRFSRTYWRPGIGHQPKGPLNSNPPKGGSGIDPVKKTSKT